MRLDFNVVIIDDDWTDPEHKEEVEELKDYVYSYVGKKGFRPEISIYQGVQDFKNNRAQETKDRVDLFLSDNNLEEEGNGIDFYIEMSKEKIHDFVLYTRDDRSTIVDKLVNDLQDTQNPNLFTRFTFVKRESDKVWFENIEEIIDLVLTKREEINNLRGLYAQQMAKVENFLKEKVPNSQRLDLIDLIDQAQKLGMLEANLAKKISFQRCRRNAFIHNDEEYCRIRKAWYIPYNEYNPESQKCARPKKAYEQEFDTLRTQLAAVVEETLAL